MGGLAFICAIIIVGLCMLGFGNRETNLILTITASFTVVGFLDDFLKIYHNENQGPKTKPKIKIKLSLTIVTPHFW